MDNYLPQQFTNELFGSIRVLDINNEPWFVATDIAKALGYADATHLTRNIIDPRDKGLQKVETLGGSQDLSVINESGLYSAIFSSRLPAAIEFKHWVTSEVLPSMRKIGFSRSMQLLDEEKQRAKMVAQCCEQSAFEAGCREAQLASELFQIKDKIYKSNMSEEEKRYYNTYDNNYGE